MSNMTMILVAPVLVASLACSPGNLVSNSPLPPGVPDPTGTHNPAGAAALYVGALVKSRTAFGGDANSFVPVTGLMTDELRSTDIGLIGSSSAPMAIDSRIMPEYPGGGQTDNITPSPIGQLYSILQRARGQISEARGALHAYAPATPPALYGHLDALEGYADLMLAEAFCSGIPLSTLDFNQNYTLKPGSTTQHVYETAITLFDSALAISSDSDRILNLARVGKGRALLAFGQYADAAAAVSLVPDDYRYAWDFNTAVSGSTTSPFENLNFAFFAFNPGGPLTMVDQEGGNGPPFLSSGDPRSAWAQYGENLHHLPEFRPLKYDQSGDSAIVMASGIEARLIKAEYEVDAGASTWINTLNALRTDGTYTTQPDPVDPTRTDTLWNPGTGHVAGLRPLTDPGSPDARVALVFTERAYWLFLTGHRQGDLRRLVRQYGRAPDQVYPTGPYPGGHGLYGNDVTAPIPGDERISNPLFHGCLSRGA